jgi:hypothetical protein
MENISRHNDRDDETTQERLGLLQPCDRSEHRTLNM